jgi:iodotyrosine deiodinase
VTLTSTPLNCGPALRALLHRPDNEKLMLLLPVGYPAEDATVPEITKKNAEEIIIHY